MGTFTDSIVVELTENRDYPYRIYKEFEFHSGHKNSGLFIRVPAGFEFDGTSIPKALQWCISPSDPDVLQASSIHDKAFRDGTAIMSVMGAEREVPITRQTANGFMAEAMIARNVPKWKQACINFGLAVGSKGPWKRLAKQRNAVRTETTE